MDSQFSSGRSCVQFHKTGRLSEHIQAIGFFRKEHLKDKIRRIRDNH